jgi:hypothetical protein
MPKANTKPKCKTTCQDIPVALLVAVVGTAAAADGGSGALGSTVPFRSRNGTKGFAATTAVLLLRLLLLLLLL